MELANVGYLTINDNHEMTRSVQSIVAKPVFDCLILFIAWFARASDFFYGVTY